jgi:hypothetical protein
MIGVDKFLARDKYDDNVLTLVEVTRDIVRDKLQGDAWAMWAIAQRASLPVKIDACIEYVCIP